MQEQYSPTALALCAVLSDLGLPIDSRSLADLLELPEGDFAGLSETLAASGTVISRDGDLLPGPSMPGPAAIHRMMEDAMAPFPRSSFIHMIFSYYKGIHGEFLRNAVERLARFVQQHDIVRSYYLYILTARLLTSMTVDTSDKLESSEFLHSSIRVQKVMQMFPWNVDAAPALYEKMARVAEQCGDLRSLCWIKFATGTLNINMMHVKSAAQNHKAMHEGLQLMNELGDSSIITHSMGMVSLYYFIEGEFTKSINCAFSCLYTNETDDVDFERLLFSYAGLSAIALGEYDVAISILTRAIDRASRRRTMLNTDGLRGILAYARLLHGDEDEAIEIINDILGMNASTITYARLTCTKVLAYFHYSHGRIRPAWSVLHSWLSRNGKRGLIHSNCLATPFMLDILAAFELHGMESPFPNSVQEELETALASPSKLLRAAALRTRAALSAASNGPAASAVLDDLEASRDILQSIHAPAEMCRTLAALAKAQAAAGRTPQAAAAAAAAAAMHDSNPRLPWDDGLAALCGKSSGTPSRRAPSPADILANMLQTMRDQYTWEDRGEFFKSLLCSIMASLNITHGAIFRNGSPGDSESAVNIDASSFAEEKRNAMEELVLKAWRERKTLWKKIRHDDAPASTAIALFLPTESVGDYVLFLEGELREQFSAISFADLLPLIENFCATEATMFLKSLDQWKSMTAVAPNSGRKPESAQFYHASPVMNDIVERIDRIAPKDTTVLILGESGSGKELVARRLHEQSGRPGGFVAVNIASTPEDLFESEFYGHEKGSFSGASYQKRGLFELADKGTLFIDEVGDIPPFLQVKLLRVLQEHKFMRVGGTRVLHSDFRLVAATNRNLEEAVRKGSFREDLYYRLSVVPLRIPPLRERPDDILHLARAFLREYAERDSSRPKAFAPGMEQAMLKYAWPGNVRELRNFVERYSIMPESASLLPSLSPRAIPARAPSAMPLPETGTHPTLDELNDRYFEQLYMELNGVIGGKSGIASVLGISRTTAYAWMERLHLRDKYEKRIQPR